MGRKVSEEQRAKVRAFAAMLSEKHPATFPPGKSASVPLKIGIHRDVIARYPGEDALTVKHFFIYHVYSRPYLRATSVAGTPRLDLNGSKAGVVTEEQSQAARDALAKIGKRKKQAEPQGT